VSVRSTAERSAAVALTAAHDVVASQTARSSHPTATNCGRGVEVAGVSKRFGAVQALESVDLVVPPGTVTALVGRNGAGKSTLLRVLATSVLPDGGTAALSGHDVVADPGGARRHLGLVLGDDRSFFWRLNGRQNLEFFGRLHGLRRAALAGRVEWALESVELTDVAERRVDRYSTGMRSRLGIARALLGDPSVLLLDEPTRSLDAVSTDTVRGLLLHFAKGEGAAVVLVTHDLREAATVADEVVVLRDGCVADRQRPPFDAARLELAMVGGE